MDISALTLDQLKALCYDQIVVLNQTQANIQMLQAEIAKREKAAEIVPEAAPANGRVREKVT